MSGRARREGWHPGEILRPEKSVANPSGFGRYFLVMTEQLPDRTFGWSNMFVATRESDPREQGDPPAGERDTLARFLRDYRLTLELKCEGLDVAAMAAQSVPPSDLSMLGLLRHLAAVEQFWFRRVLAGQGAPALYRSAEDRNEAFQGAVADPAVVAEAWDSWRGEVAFAEQFVAAQEDLGTSISYENGLGEQDSVTVRAVLVHVIEEYARHMGHADFLRERIDGRVGQ
jgi:uncharacterized damage-inducible protein DinB